MDLTTLTDEELAKLRSDVGAEVDRRLILINSVQKIDAISAEYHEAVGNPKGSDWVQPQGAHDAYPMNWEVTHGGKVWKSLIPNNVWEPGDPNNPVVHTLWEEVVPPVEEPPLEEEPPAEEPPAVAEWDGNAKAYAVNDLVSFSGQTYRCLQAHTSQPGWTPVVVPALWAIN